MKTVSLVMLLAVASPAFAATSTPPVPPTAPTPPSVPVPEAKKLVPARQIYDSNRKLIPSKPSVKPGPDLG